MKKLLLLTAIIMIGSLHTYSQDESFNGELYVPFINRPANWEFTVKIEAYGTVWDQNHDITNEFHGGDTTYIYNNVIRNSHSSDLDWDNQGWVPVLSLGLYKVSIWEGQNQRAWFFINHRTGDFPPHTPTWVDPDLVLEYDVTNKEFDFTYPDLGTVVNGTYYAHWDLKEELYQITSNLEDYWDNCLVAIPDADNHPRFVWGQYPDYLQGTITGYKLYRSASHIPGQPPSNFTVLATLDDDEFDYVDNTVTIGTDYNAKSYYIKCVYEYPQENVLETEATNTVEVRLEIPQKISIDNNSFSDKDFYLEQNYPNPFNPSTKINFTIPKNDFVNLKVYDVLGNEVQSLLNEVKDAGIYSLEFNADDLPSGIYLYKLQSGSFVDTKKMILIK